MFTVETLSNPILSNYLNLFLYILFYYLPSQSLPFPLFYFMYSHQVCLYLKPSITPCFYISTTLIVILTTLIYSHLSFPSAYYYPILTTTTTTLSTLFSSSFIPPLQVCLRLKPSITPCPYTLTTLHCCYSGYKRAPSPSQGPPRTGY